jgi:hypothetical protein
MDKDTALAHLHAELRLKRLSRRWAKLEILLGLLAAGAGIFLGLGALLKLDEPWPYLTAALALFVFGGYLALAGHRSHLYQSNNELAAYLAEAIRSAKEAGP